MPDKFNLYVIIRDLGIFGVQYLKSNQDTWSTELLDAHFFTKKNLAYERMDMLKVKDTLMKLHAIQLAVD